jgi:hypothetical protein
MTQRDIVLPGILLVALSLNTGCTTNEYKSLPLERQQRDYGTQPGYHMLSEYFSVDVNERLMRFYFLGQRKNEKRLLGTIATVWGDYANYGPREIAYAISNDGKRLLFFDEPGIDEGKPRGMKNGVGVADLYIFDVQKEGKTLVYRDVHRQSFSCVRFPRNFIYYGRVPRSVTIDPFAYSTEGREISLEDRRKKLFESGNAAKICGPLEVTSG